MKTLLQIIRDLSNVNGFTTLTGIQGAMYAAGHTNFLGELRDLTRRGYITRTPGDGIRSNADMYTAVSEDDETEIAMCEAMSAADAEGVDSENE